MSETCGRAVAVGLDEAALRALRPALARAGFGLAGQAGDGPSGLRLLGALQPALAVAGAVMPVMDGAAFVRAAAALRLQVRPALVLLRPPGLPLPGLPAGGVAVIDAPPDADGLGRALSRLAPGPGSLPPGQAARLKALLDGLGVPNHPGRACLARAVALVWRDCRRLQSLRRGLYPEVARGLPLSPAQVERAIRHVIDVAWRTGEIERQHRIFGDTIDARRGKPTCGEMIAQLAEELRWEARL